MHYLKDSPDPGSKPQGALKHKKHQKGKTMSALCQNLEIVLGPAFRLHKRLCLGKGSE